uniref:Uncharacterized protein n=1 Tax=Octactis speculum TaxID=3111310 RepID=A0A7S2HUC0_9STRA
MLIGKKLCVLISLLVNVLLLSKYGVYGNEHVLPLAADKIVLVTGGSSGIGRGAAEYLVQSCAAEVHIVARAAQQLQTVKDALQGLNTSCQHKTKVFVHPTDLSNVSQVNELFETTLADVPIDFAVLCAGITGFLGNLIDTPDEIFRNVHDAVNNNFYATALALRGVLRIMAEQESGSIVVISSDNGVSSSPGGSFYGASKAALINLVKSVAVEVAGYGIRVNGIAPGLINTPITWNQARYPALQPYQCLSEENTTLTADYTCDEPECVCPNLSREDYYNIEPISEIVASWPIQRIGEPRDIATMIMFLLDERLSSFITGQIISIDGGLTAEP